jgi:hypothetical protein
LVASAVIVGLKPRPEQVGVKLSEPLPAPPAWVVTVTVVVAGEQLVGRRVKAAPPEAVPLIVIASELTTIGPAGATVTEFGIPSSLTTSVG